MLAGDDPALIVGGVVGDWIKGPLPGDLPPDLARGAALHRALDAFADLNPAFRRSCMRVSQERRRYSGVLVDIFYDHVLAQNWPSLRPQPLADYCAGIYQLVEARLDDLSPAAHPALRLMASEDWLTSYARIDGIADVLRRMSRRTRQPNPLPESEAEFLADAEGFTDDFHAWLGDAQAFCEQARHRPHEDVIAELAASCA